MVTDQERRIRFEIMEDMKALHNARVKSEIEETRRRIREKDPPHYTIDNHLGSLEDRLWWN